MSDLIPNVNPFEDADDPIPTYRELRECPIGRMDFGQERPSFVVSRYEDVRYVVKNADIFSSCEAIDIGNDRPMIPLQIDPPEHAKYRRLMDPYLGPKEVAKLEDDIRKLTNQIIDGFIDKDQINFHEEFSVPLPCTMFLRLLGLPIEDMEMFVGWKDDIIRPDIEWGDLEAAREIRERTGAKIYDYFGRVVDDRLAKPGDDLLSEFAHGEVEGRSLTKEEILDICYLFILAGLDTVTATLDCYFAYLASHQERRKAIVDDPGLIPGVVEELLRHETPVQGFPRTVTRKVTLHGVDLEPGDHVLVVLGSANTDPEEFEDPDEVHFDRQNNRHLSFGGGPHRCLGSHFARLELRIALEEFHQRIPEYSVRSGAVLSFSPGIREVADLPLLLTTEGARP